MLFTSEGKAPIENKLTSSSLVTDRVICKEIWDAIIRCKEQFIVHGIDPRQSKVIRPEVAESWIRSRKLGIFPNNNLMLDYLLESEIEKIYDDNKLLIEVATPLINNFMELATSSGYALQLFSKEGIHIEGSRINTIKIDKNSIVRNVTTTAHGLAILHKKPYQLIGPENYLEVLQNVISSAAPILDENNDVLGVLALIQDMGRTPWELNLHSLQAHSLGWISSLAIAIASQIKLSSSIKDLRKANETLGVTFELFDEGVVTIEPDGTIVRTNQVGNSILNLEDQNVRSHNIREYITNPSTLLDNLCSKKNQDYVEEKIRSRNCEKSYLISTRPIFKPNSDELERAILRFNHPDKINSLVTNRSGARAKYNFEDIIGESEPMKNSKNMAMRFAASRENILLLGESGTGKELFAQAIHNNYRPSGPFIAVNCAAMPRNLIESELFGYERGAFTGAEKSGRPGKIELSNGGTLFLDEIGDMPYELQAVMLRVLQDKQVMRLGGTSYHKVDFRLIAATNQNLEKLISEKIFREDLYFRLSVLAIEIPPLRERGMDIATLANYFVREYSERMGYPVPKISPAALQAITQHYWPGNVRQLENAMIYAVNIADNKIINIHHLPRSVSQETDYFRNLKTSPNFKTSLIETKNLSAASGGINDLSSMKDYEKSIIENALLQSGNRVAKAAKLLGVSKTTIYRKAKKYGIDFYDED